MDHVRAVYERFFVVFPAAANQRISYVKMELSINELQHVERIFPMSLFNAPNVKLWSMYLDYNLRHNNQTRDTGGNTGADANQYYEFELNNVGSGREAGRIWTEYIEGCPIELSNLTKDLRRDTISRLLPAPGYEGYQDYIRQVELRKRWILWEMVDPLALAKEDPAGLSMRIIYVFKQPLMALSFCPEIWFDAAGWCFANGTDNQAVDLLNQGMIANPESCPQHFKFVERLEATNIIEGGGEVALIRTGQLVRKPYINLLNMLYKQVENVQRNEKAVLDRIAHNFELTNTNNVDNDEDDDPNMVDTRAAKDTQVAT
ncbi:hypothetical protein HOY82DRAFT_646835 [Tuber indicum]|nr:hypothetical protein HOY82DRAFT_646835 [Tuber indicum]